MRTRQAGLRPRPQHEQTERAGWDRLCVKGCGGKGDLGSIPPLSGLLFPVLGGRMGEIAGMGWQSGKSEAQSRAGQEG